MSRITLSLAALVLTCVAPLSAQYCIPQATGMNCGFSDEYIANITITDASSVVVLNNSSTCPTVPAYEDFTTTVAPVVLVPGATYTLSVTVGNYWSSDSVHLWIDSNQNFSFEDAGELLISMSSGVAGSGAAPLTLTGSITVPPGTLAGAPRLRARIFYAAVPAIPSCTNAIFGNCEDYAGLIGGVLSPEYQVNQPVSSLDFDGVANSAFAALTSNYCAGSLVTANVATTTPGAGWDIALSFAPVVPASAGGIVLPGGQIVNVNYFAGLVWLNGGANPSFLPIPGSFPIAFGAPAAPFTFAAQQLVIDPTNPIFVAFSQAAAMSSVAALMQTLPNADDAVYTVNLAALCAPNVAYYGTTYTELSVSTNGVVSPGPAGVFGWTPSTAAAITNPGSFGIWSDWQSNANPAASIVVNGAGLFGGVDVTYTNVPYWGSAVNSSFTLGLDPGGPRIEGISGLGTNPTGTMIVVSQGGGLATDAGATAFGIAGGATAAATDMLYALGTGSPALAGGANNLWFNWFGGGVSWTGF